MDSRRSRLWWQIIQKEWAGDWFHEQTQWTITRETELSRRWCAAMKDLPERARLPWRKLLATRFRQLLRFCSDWWGTRFTSDLFVKVLLKRERLTLWKVSGTENPADLGTMVLDVNTHRHLCSINGLGSATQAVEEIKGHKKNTQNSGNVGLQSVREGLRRFFLGLTQWTQENSMSMNFHEIRIWCKSDTGLKNHSLFHWNTLTSPELCV